MTSGPNRSTIFSADARLVSSSSMACSSLSRDSAIATNCPVVADGSSVMDSRPMRTSNLASDLYLRGASDRYAKVTATPTRKVTSIFPLCRQTKRSTSKGGRSAW